MVPPSLHNFPPWMLLGLGGVVGWFKSFWNFIYDHSVGYLVKKIKVEIVVEEQEHEEAFMWVNLWMEKHLRNRKIVALRLQRSLKKESYEIVPSYGFYWVWWNRKLLTFHSEKKEPEGGSGAMKSMAFRRMVTITLWGTRDREKIMEVLTEAQTQFKKTHPNTLKYYTHYSSWWESNILTERNLDTVYLPESQMSDLLNDFKVFFQSRERYRSLGIPWRKGYLFEGPPGSGKSTLVQALSTNFETPVYYLNLHAKIDGETAQSLLRSAVSPCIVLIEDVDCINAAKSRTADDEEKEENKLQTSDLLNILDGLVASEGRIVIMTTNHPDKLDSALVRAGRVDRRFHIGYAKDTELKRFHEKASEYYSLPEFSDFRKSLPEKCTIAEAQNKVFQGIDNQSN